MSQYANGVTKPLPDTESVAPGLLTLPIGVRMTLDEAAYVADTFAALVAASLTQRRSS
jgi:dTDP-4-amino-4,6-dideoxygalactose transaminase